LIDSEESTQYKPSNWGSHFNSQLIVEMGDMLRRVSELKLYIFFGSNNCLSYFEAFRAIVL